MSFTESVVLAHLTNKNYTVNILDTVTSTNTLLKEQGRKGAPHGTILAARSQTAGRGRLGREFYSPADTGLYFSILLRPELPPTDSLLITTAAAVACARVLERISGKEALIKWVNDIYIDGKKVCGILTEASITSPEKIDFAVLGIGINITVPKDGFPAAIVPIAGALTENPNDLRSILLAEILNEFSIFYSGLQERSFIFEYRSRSMLDGHEIDVITPNETRPAKALYVDNDLTLVVQFPDGKIGHLSTGDVSIKRR